MTTPFVLSTMKWVSAVGLDISEMHWFDISGIDRSAGIEGDWLRQYRPPFEKCMVLYQGPTKDGRLYEVILNVAGSDPEDGIVVSMHKGEHGRMPRALPLMVYLIDGDQIRFGAVDDDRPISKEEAELMLAFLASWYASLARGCEAYVSSVKPTFTNRRKIAQGKPPTYEWRTVVIEPRRPQPVGQSHGGTHASPRQHDRRGHLRRLRSGKNVWVRPCVVGDPSKGAVFHDYEVRAA